jgi:hypothetical protein
MSRRVLSIAALVLAVTALCAESSLAKTVAVGPATCRPDLAHYPTIQGAINAVGAGDTVLVCARPAPYPEQIVINKAITVRGIADGNNGAVVIAVPAGPIQNVFMEASGWVAAQVVLQNARDAALANLVIDGTGIPCATTLGAVSSAGIAVSRVGSADTRATIRKVVVRRQAGGCGLGDGILVEQSEVTIDSSSIHGIERSGIRQFAGSARIKDNSLQDGINGIWLSKVQGGIVALNTVGTFQNGIMVDDSNKVTVSENVLGAWVGHGIWLKNGAKDNVVTLNKTASDWYGIALDSGAMKNTVTFNTIVRSGGAGILNSAAGFSGVSGELGNRITDNEINESPIGIYDYNSGDKFVGNSFLNVTVLLYP